MGFRVADVVGLVWSHPVVSVGVLLLFTPPLFPIVVYFSPLLISTALVVLAMVSMGSDVDETPSYSSDSQYKRGWIEDDVSDDGPFLEGERVSKRLKASSKDESWFGIVKNWEGTGRAWMDSVLSQESRRVGSATNSDDENAIVKEDVIPPLETTRETLTSEDKSNPDRNPESFVPKDTLLVKSADNKSADNKSADNKSADNKSADNKSVDKAVTDSSVTKPEIVAKDLARSVEETNDFIEITPASESEDESHIVITPRSIVPPVPLLKNRSLPKPDAVDIVTKDELATENVSTKDIKPTSLSTDKVAEKGRAIDDTDAESKIALPIANSCVEKELIAPAPEQGIAKLTSLGDHRKEELAVLETSSNATQVPSKVSNPQLQIHTDSTSRETNAVSADASNGGPARLPPAGQSDGAPEISKASQSREVKSAAELLAPLRQGHPYGLGTPSAAVALSEKLNVPLEDIMSLLAGDDKEILPDDEPAGKGSSSETTTSQDEEWSSSDDESSNPFKAEVGQSVEKKDL